jgi:hypothetical protein
MAAAGNMYHIEHLPYSHNRIWRGVCSLASEEMLPRRSAISTARPSRVVSVSSITINPATVPTGRRARGDVQNYVKPRWIPTARSTASSTVRKWKFDAPPAPGRSCLSGIPQPGLRCVTSGAHTRHRFGVPLAAGEPARRRRRGRPRHCDDDDRSRHRNRRGYTLTSGSDCAETDSLLEGSGFDLSVPLGQPTASNRLLSLYRQLGQLRVENDFFARKRSNRAGRNSARWSSA